MTAQEKLTDTFKEASAKMKQSFGNIMAKAEQQEAEEEEARKKKEEAETNEELEESEEIREEDDKKDKSKKKNKKKSVDSSAKDLLKVGSENWMCNVIYVF